MVAGLNFICRLFLRVFEPIGEADFINSPIIAFSIFSCLLFSSIMFSSHYFYLTLKSIIQSTFSQGKIKENSLLECAKGNLKVRNIVRVGIQTDCFMIMSVRAFHPCFSRIGTDSVRKKNRLPRLSQVFPNRYITAEPSEKETKQQHPKIYFIAYLNSVQRQIPT